MFNPDSLIRLKVTDDIDEEFKEVIPPDICGKYIFHPSGGGKEIVFKLEEFPDFDDFISECFEFYQELFKEEEEVCSKVFNEMLKGMSIEVKIDKLGSGSRKRKSKLFSSDLLPSAT
jgi:hypothetical protein